jgi:MoaA/NifB/PqqE/SkfB family radical SAM enzyme
MWDSARADVNLFKDFFHVLEILTRVKGRKHLVRKAYTYLKYSLRTNVYETKKHLMFWKKPPGDADVGCRFCHRPFEWFEIKSDGSVYLCCSGWLPKPVGNLFRSHPDRIWNSYAAKKIRSSILDGSFAYCRVDQCAFLRTNSLPTSAKLVENRTGKIPDEALTVSPFSPRVINVGYDRTCNLACPSCRAEIIHLKDKMLERSLALQARLLGWEKLSEVGKICLSGSGDPFASTVYREFLTKFDPQQYPNLRLDLRTNGLLFSERLWDSLPNIHDSIDSVHISIDAATSATYKTLRRGGNFDVLLKRLEFIGNLRASGHIRQLIYSFVVQKTNFREMPNFVELAKKGNCDSVNFKPLLDWGTYSKAFLAALQVHEPAHPEHSDFLEVLSAPSLRDPMVKLAFTGQ